MNLVGIRGKEAWVETIGKNELPAFAATVRSLEKLADDDTASLPALGQSVLHDQGLTTRVLKVANSVVYSSGRNPVTTVSRAAVILGYDTIKHICITAKMIDSMLRNRDISPSVYKRLLRLMAKSFHSAMLAKMLLGDRTSDTQEEVYITALLHELGEIAFWSVGGKITEELDAELQKNSEGKDRVIQKMLGTNFEQLSLGLANLWNMGEMLTRSIENPSSRTPEMRAIGLASDYSSALTDPNSDVNLSNCIKEMSELLGVSERQLRVKLKHCTEQSVELAVSYGAKAITRFLDPKADLSRFEQEEVHHKPDELMQLKMLRELTHIATDYGDVNLLVHTAIEGLHRGVGMDRAMVFMLNQAKNKMKPRFVSCRHAEKIETGFVFSLSDQNTVFDEAYEKRKPIWVDAPNSSKWRNRLTPQLHGLVKSLPFFVGPLMVNKKCIGLVYADRAETKGSLNGDDFSAFNHFTGQLSLCLSLRVVK